MAAVYKHAEEQNLEVTAVCDPWKVRREEAADRAARHNGREPRQFTSHREVIALQDVDAVMIASPDHLHTTQLQAAARAGKDAYCEKPLGMELDKLKSACDAVREEGIVF